jgi:hypothetical protein
MLTKAPRCDHWMFANKRLMRASDVASVPVRSICECTTLAVRRGSCESDARAPLSRGSEGPGPPPILRRATRASTRPGARRRRSAVLPQARTVQ